MAAEIQLLIVQGDEALEASDLDAAERCYAAALTAALDPDSNDNVLRALVKLAGRFIKLGVRNRPQSLYKHLETLPLLERTRVMEWLARHHRQKGDLAEAEKIYLEIFDIKANGLGFSHEETTAALQTAALILQMQGKSPEGLYLKALSGAKTVPASPASPIPTAATPAPSPSPSPQPATADKTATPPTQTNLQPPPRQVNSPPPPPIQSTPAQTATPRVQTQPAVQQDRPVTGGEQPLQEGPDAVRPVLQQPPAANAPKVKPSGQTTIPKIELQPPPAVTSKLAPETKIQPDPAPGAPEVKASTPPAAQAVEPTTKTPQPTPIAEPKKEQTGQQDRQTVKKPTAGGLDLIDAILAGGATNAPPTPPPPKTAAPPKPPAQPQTISEPAPSAPAPSILPNGGAEVVPAAQSSPPVSKPSPAAAAAAHQTAMPPAAATAAGLSPEQAEPATRPIVIASVPSASNTTVAAPSATPGHGNATITAPIAAESPAPAAQAAPPSTATTGNVQAKSSMQTTAPLATTTNAPAESKSKEVSTPAQAVPAPSTHTPTPQEQTAPPVFPPPSVPYPPNWHEVAVLWRSCSEILSERLTQNLKAKPLDKATRIVLEKLRSKVPAFMSALEKTTAEKLQVNTKRSSVSDRIDWMIAEDLAELYKQWSNWKKRPYEIALIYALMLRVDFLGPCHEDTLTTLHRLGYVYASDEHSFQNDEAAETLLRLSLLLHEITVGDEDRRTINNLMNLATIYGNNEAPSAAEPLFRRALDASMRSNALTQEELVELLRAFARCSELRGDFTLAAELHEKMRTIFEAISLDSSELFETIHNLVVCYDRSGNQDKAKQYHQRLLWETDWLEHPNAMAMREWCAMRYEEAEQFERAEQMNKDIISSTQPGDALARNALQALVRIYERTGRHREAERLRNPWYDPDKSRPRPQQVTSPTEAILFAGQAVRGGNLSEALDYYKSALLGAETDNNLSLQVIDGLRELGAAHWRNSHLKVALEVYRMAAEAAQRLLGAASTDTASCLHEAAVLEDHLEEQANKAGEYFKQAFEIRLRLLGPDNIDTSESAYEYAKHFRGDRQHKESVLKLAIAGRERHTGLCDDRTKAYVDELVRLYAEDGQFSGVAGISGPRFEFADDPLVPPASKSKRFAPARNPGALAPVLIGSDPVASLAASLDERKFTVGIEHPDTVAKAMQIIDLYEETDDSPELWTDVPAVSHLFCGLSLQLLAHHFMSSGDYARASATFDTVLRIREEVMGRSHPDAAMSLCDLAVLAMRKKEYRDAERLYTRASEIFESRLGESNLHTAAAYHNMAVVLHKRKRKTQAEALYRKVLQLLERSGSTEGSRKLVCLKNLESLTGGSGQGD